MEAMIYGRTLHVFRIAVNCNVGAYEVRTLRRNILGDAPSLYANAVNYLSADM
jgi:hypothetical protein